MNITSAVPKKSRHEWSEWHRGMVWGCWLAQGKKGIRRVAELTGIPKSTCNDIIKAYEEHGVQKPPPRPGRPPILKARDMRHLNWVVERNPWTPLAQLQREFAEASGICVSSYTIRRALYVLGYHGCAGARKPWISRVNRIIRLKWCHAHLNWDEKWKSVVWSDESRFKLFHSDGRVWTWRKVGFRHHTNHLIPTLKYGGGSIMVWACFSWNGLGPLIIVDGTMNAKKYLALLADIKDTLFQQFGDLNGLIYQQDNAPCHKAKVVMDWLKKENVPLLPWPAQSPDLSPIEHLWDELDRRIRARKILPKNLTELKAALQEEWATIPSPIYQKLASSMGNRVSAVIAAKGGPTRY